MVLRALHFGPKTQSQIAEHTTLSRETVRQCILRLKAKGQIIGSSGVYEITHQTVAA
jgi:DNA-binding transcriptional regulator LsrR (DeoR family)